MKKIKVIILILILFLIGQPVLAKTPTLCERTEDNHYQVNKKWTISDKNLSNVTNTPCVDANEKIYDFSEVLTEEEYKNLQEKMNKYVAKTNMDIVIVIDNVYYLSDSTNETYASDFYDYNDFGLDFDYYSGTLFFRNTYEQDPYYNIYTFGEAQLYYSYNRLENILDYVYDDIHSGNYYEGFSTFIDELDKYYDMGKATNSYTLDENGFLQKKYVYPIGWIFIISLSVTLITMIILVKKNKMIAKAYQAEEYADPQSVNIDNRVDQFLTTHTTSYTVSSSSGGGGGGGFHSSGGSSGGGHSGGGGRHG